MKICTVEGCDRKHHAKGFCKIHYNQTLSGPKNANEKCSIQDCNSLIGKYGCKGLCSKHYARLRRTGDPEKTTRFKKYASLTEFISNSSEELKLDYIFEDRSQWGFACKKYYGDICSICGWDSVTCDVHHILPIKEGGLNTISNGQVLCPNHHAIIHRTKKINN